MRHLEKNLRTKCVYMPSTATERTPLVESRAARVNELSRIPQSICKMSYVRFSFIALLCCAFWSRQMAAVKLNREEIFAVQVFPSEADVVIGDDFYLMSKRTLTPPVECSYRSPGQRDDIIVDERLRNANGR